MAKLRHPPGVRRRCRNRQDAGPAVAAVSGREPSSQPAITLCELVIFFSGLGSLSALALLAQLVEHLHGKEGVDGSSPSEGFGDCSGFRPRALPTTYVWVSREH